MWIPRELSLVAFAILAYARQTEDAFVYGLTSQNVLGGDEYGSMVLESDKNEAILLKSFDNVTLDQWSYYYTHGLHVAGTNETQAQWTADKFAEYGWTAPELARYYTFLMFPISQSLTLTNADGATIEFDLQEAALPQDETTNYPNSVPSFQGFAFSGNVTGEFIYVGQAQREDFERLIDLGVSLEGKIALIKYGGLLRGLKIRNAKRNGMAGAIIYSDIDADGKITTANGYAAYPEGPARNPTAVERGSLLEISLFPGDPTTPNYPSKEDSPRIDPSNIIPQIPSLPLSWSNGEKLVKALDGYGVAGSEVNTSGWMGAFNASYSTGPIPGVTLALDNQMRTTTTWIWDAIGYINGTDYPDEVVVVGNHRDAWIIGGAGDPNSGSAILIELSKAFGKLLETGWKPKRTIVIASWDGEESGLFGSTEWVEEYLPWLKVSAVAYLNIDVGTSGPDPHFSGAPDLYDIAEATMKKVEYPNYRGKTGLSLYDVWYSLTEGEAGVLGSGSDYTAFVHDVGTSCLDTGAGRGSNDPVYHYHSNYDSYHWMVTYGDPGFQTHKVMGSFLTLLAYNMVSRDIIPLNPETYALKMTSSLSTTRHLIDKTNAKLGSKEHVDLTPIFDAIEVFNVSAKALNSLIASTTADTDKPTIREINRKLRDYQREFIGQGGLPGHEYYKHVFYAPGLDTGYAAVVYPGVAEQVGNADWDLARLWVDKTSQAILSAARVLQP